MSVGVKGIDLCAIDRGRRSLESSRNSGTGRVAVRIRRSRRLTVETPFGTDSAIIELGTNEKHPQLGTGCLRRSGSAPRLAVVSARARALDYLAGVRGRLRPLLLQ